MQFYIENEIKINELLYPSIRLDIKKMLMIQCIY